MMMDSSKERKRHDKLPMELLPCSFRRSLTLHMESRQENFSRVTFW